MKIKGAIFDMDGTIVDSLGFWNYFWELFGKKYYNCDNFRPREEDDREIRTMLLKDAAIMICQRYPINESHDELLKYINDLIRDFYSTVSLKKDMREFLDFLSKNGVRMCIASATEKSLIELAVDHCGIAEYFDGIISCADVGKGKDCPDVFNAALDFLGTPKGETWIFEDSLLAVKTATKVGFKTVGIYDDNNYCQDELSEISTHYIGKNDTILRLI